MFSDGSPRAVSPKGNPPVRILRGKGDEGQSIRPMRMGTEQLTDVVFQTGDDTCEAGESDLGQSACFALGSTKEIASTRLETGWRERSSMSPGRRDTDRAKSLQQVKGQHIFIETTMLYTPTFPVTAAQGAVKGDGSNQEVHPFVLRGDLRDAPSSQRTASCWAQLRVDLPRKKRQPFFA